MHLFAAATREGGIRFLGDISVINFGEDHGAVVVLTAELENARRVAETEPASMILRKDVRQFADLFKTRVTRPGSYIPTSGNMDDLLLAAGAMESAGLDYSSWHLPILVKQTMRQRAMQNFASTTPTAA